MEDVADKMKKAIENGSHVNLFRSVYNRLDADSMDDLFGEHIRWIVEKEKWFVFNDFLSISEESGQLACAAALISAMEMEDWSLFDQVVVKIKEIIADLGNYSNAVSNFICKRNLLVPALMLDNHQTDAKTNFALALMTSRNEIRLDSPESVAKGIFKIAASDNFQDLTLFKRQTSSLLHLISEKIWKTHLQTVCSIKTIVVLAHYLASVLKDDPEMFYRLFWDLPNLPIIAVVPSNWDDASEYDSDNCMAATTIFLLAMRHPQWKFETKPTATPFSVDYARVARAFGVLVYDNNEELILEMYEMVLRLHRSWSFFALQEAVDRIQLNGEQKEYLKSLSDLVKSYRIWAEINVKYKYIGKLYRYSGGYGAACSVCRGRKNRTVFDLHPSEYCSVHPACVESVLVGCTECPGCEKKLKLFSHADDDALSDGSCSSDSDY